MSQLLTNENIAASVEELSQYYNDNKTDKSVALKNTLFLEEVLLKYRDELGADTEYSLDLYKKLGKRHAVLKVKGRYFNPTESSSDEEDNIINNLLENIGAFPTHNYSKGTNIIDLQTEKRQLSTLNVLILSLVLSIILGLINKYLIPDSISDTIITEIMDPLSGIFRSFLNTVIGPVIFFTIVCATINIGDLSTFKTFGKKVLRSLFFYSILIFLVSICIPTIILGFEDGGSASSPFIIIRDTLISIVPNDFVSPFSTNSILQLLFLGIVVGLALLVMAEQNSSVAKALRAINEVFKTLMTFVGKLLPFYIFTSIFVMVSGDSLAITEGKIPIMFYFLCMILTFIFMTILAAVIGKISPIKLLKYSFSAVFTGFTTCSSILALSEAMNALSDKDKFNISKKNSDFITPLSQVLFKPAAAAYFYGLMLGFIKITNTPFSPSLFFTLLLLSFIFGIASPPCVCGGVAIIALLFETLHINTASLPLAITLDILLDHTTTALVVYSNFICVVLINAKVSKKR